MTLESRRDFQLLAKYGTLATHICRSRAKPEGL
jgi:hypothetical protein